MLQGARNPILLLAMLDLLVSLRGYGQSPDHSQSQLPSLIVSARAGDVTRVDGNVWLKRRGESSLLPLRIGKRLSSGDVVVTGDQGRAEWSLNVGSYFQVAAHSQVSVYEESPDQMHFDISQGEVFVIVGTFERGTVLEIDTPYALLTVTKRGSYRVRVSTNKDTEADVARGELQFADSKGQTGKVTKREHVRFFGIKK
ncbi:MAG TPA: FecR domain-containing protein [Blastocatellia bacterium]|nr:FecR domain-containing protein [Blastocatellia bacterium]